MNYKKVFFVLVITTKLLFCAQDCSITDRANELELFRQTEYPLLSKLFLRDNLIAPKGKCFFDIFEEDKDGAIIRSLLKIPALKAILPDEHCKKIMQQYVDEFEKISTVFETII